MIEQLYHAQLANQPTSLSSDSSMGPCYCFDNSPTLFISYHPSPQNTNTGKLTAASFQKLLKEIQTGFNSRSR